MIPNEYCPSSMVTLFGTATAFTLGFKVVAYSTNDNAEPLML